MKIGKLLKAGGMLGIIGGAFIGAVVAVFGSLMLGVDIGVAPAALGFVAFVVGRCFD